MCIRDRRYIETLREGERIQEVYLCKQKTGAMTKTGKEYENVILQDKTGQLDAKIWDPGSMGIDDFGLLDYVEVHGDVTLFNGQTQLSIKRARKVSKDSVDEADYLPCTDKNMDEMMAEPVSYTHLDVYKRQQPIQTTAAVSRKSRKFPER